MTTEINHGALVDVLGDLFTETTACGEACPGIGAWHVFAAFANELSTLAALAECYDCDWNESEVTCNPSATYATPYQCPGYRFPTEAEWEYAARGGTTTATYAGDLSAEGYQETLDPIAWSWSNTTPGIRGWNVVEPAKTKEPNLYNLYDLLGNVSEWCHDWHGAYPDGPGIDPAGPATGSERVHRGGSVDSGAWSLRAASRSSARPEYSFVAGARLVRSDL